MCIRDREITQCDVDVDVVIDFSNAGAVDELLDYCVKKSLTVVLCTTGLSDEPVSYTHLDVYKRQGWNLKVLVLKAFCILDTFHDISPEFLMPVLA